jgi:hypothetical protein
MPRGKFKSKSNITLCAISLVLHARTLVIFFSLSLYLLVQLPVCASIRVFIRLSACLFAYLPACPYAYLPAFPYAYLPAYFNFCLSASQSVYLFVHLSACVNLCFHLSSCLPDYFSFFLPCGYLNCSIY